MWRWLAPGLLLLAGGLGLWAWQGHEAGPGASQAGVASAVGAVASPVAAGGPAVAAAAATPLATAAPDSAYPRPGPGLNLLALEASPYLQLHAHNPVDWYAWGEAPFARAKAEGKLVFLSIGYSTCYWCHVMEREIFSNAQIAAQMNAHFISIKVDREERPDIDAVYMQATRLLTGGGGWPNSLFLTPDGAPFYAGSYFPPQDGFGRPGFPRVLEGLQKAWTQDHEKVLRVAGQVRQQLERMGSLAGARSTEAPPALAEVLPRALAELRKDYDSEHAGFGRGTKFPRPGSLDLLLTQLGRAGASTPADRDARPTPAAMLDATLEAMALGGIHDHLAGGFHRYATEPTWSVPHFEKMLYDNAQLVSLYARAYARSGRPLYRQVVEDTLGWLDREMRHPEGGFYSAEDAEVAGQEGASYLWSRAEVTRVLGKARAQAFFQVYQLVPLPVLPRPGQAAQEASPKSEGGVLRVRLPLAETLARAHAKNAAALLARFAGDRAKLLAVRARRPQPARDDKVLVAWNGLAIRALVDAAQALQHPAYLERARRTARFVLGRLQQPDGTLRRSYIAGQAREAGVLDDYAMLADGLLALHAATGEARWLATARGLADVLLARFQDKTGGGFFLTAEGSPLLIRPKPFEDNALPSGNAVALRVLRRLAAELANSDAQAAARYAAAAQGVVRAEAVYLEKAPSAVPASLAALASTEEPPASATASRQTAAVVTKPHRTHPQAFRLPRSGDHVHARLLPAPGQVRDGAVVQLRIDPGWHVNANPASLPFLIPTTVEAAAGAALPGVVYPPGQPFHPDFAREPLHVYAGTLEIPLPAGTGEQPLALHVQACDTQRCLPPDRVLLGRGRS